MYKFEKSKLCDAIESFRESISNYNKISIYVILFKIPFKIVRK